MHNLYAEWFIYYIFLVTERAIRYIVFVTERLYFA
jgi:hypothetical protein